MIIVWYLAPKGTHRKLIKTSWILQTKNEQSDMNKPNEDEIARKWGEIKRWETQRSIFGEFYYHLSLLFQNGDRYNYPQLIGKCHFPLARWIAGAQLVAVKSGVKWRR